MSVRKGTMVAAIAIGLVGPQGRASAQSEAKPSVKATPAVVFVVWGPDERPADRGQFFRKVQFDIRSHPVVESALVSHPEILANLDAAAKKDPAGWIRESIRVEAVGETGVFQVSCLAEKPQLAAAVANAVTDAYIKNFMDLRNEAIDNDLRRLEERRIDCQKEAIMRRHALRERMMRPSGDALSSRESLAAEADDLRETRKDLRRVRLEKTAADVRLGRERSNDRPTKIGELSDLVAVLTAQEERLVEAERAGVESLKRAEVAVLEFETARGELDRAERRVHASEDELARLKARMREWGIRKISGAKAMPD